MLTESGILTEKDWRAHLSLTAETKDLGWIELRDCFFKYSTDMMEDEPLQMFTIVEFLMADKRGRGTTSLVARRLDEAPDVDFFILAFYYC
jgi:hypothetical protein